MKLALSRCRILNLNGFKSGVDWVFLSLCHYKIMVSFSLFRIFPNKKENMLKDESCAHL